MFLEYLLESSSKIKLINSLNSLIRQVLLVKLIQTKSILLIKVSRPRNILDAFWPHLTR